ncbi:MAG: hypothetical protein R2796_02935 [Chitinophagaceae bacterium]
MRVFYIFICLLIGCLGFASVANAQSFRIRGTVYDSSRLHPMKAVTVLSTSGDGTITDSEGKYEIQVTEKDSIWFSYLNKPTIKFPVLKINNPISFDIALQVNIPVMEEVKIKLKDYKQDSIQNREDYAKIFNYKKPGLRPVVSSSGVGFDLDEIINMFRFKRNKRMASFQKRLLEQEQENFVLHRFNKGLVTRLTGLSGQALETFMRLYRPSYLFAKYANDYDFRVFIKHAYERYVKGLPPEKFYFDDMEEE